MVGILFEMTIDPKITSTPFADIQGVSYFQTEAEILFSMHTVFRIGSIKSMDKSDRLFEVQLTLTADDDEGLRSLTEQMEEDVGGGTGWQRMGQLTAESGSTRQGRRTLSGLTGTETRSGR